VVRIPAEIWRHNSSQITKISPRKKVMKKIILDPFLETAVVDLSNNTYPEEAQPSRSDLFKRRSFPQENEMQRAKRAKKLKGT